MMTREELEKAANRATELIDDGVFEVGSHWHVLVAAARKQLSQLPGPCEHGQTGPHGPFMFRNADGSIRRNCPGKVYPPETVKLIASVLCENDFDHDCDYTHHRGEAVAVLDALGETE